MESKFSVGDLVTLFQDGRVSAIKKILRITKTQIILADYSVKFSLMGHSKGCGAWDTRRIAPTLPEHVEELKRAFLLRHIDGVNFKDYSTEFLSGLFKSILDEQKRMEK